MDSSSLPGRPGQWYTFLKLGLPELNATVQTRLGVLQEQMTGSSVHLPDSSVHLPDSSVHLPYISVHLPDSSVHLPDSSVHLPDSSVHSTLRTLVDERFPGKKKVSTTLMEETILTLGSGHFLTLDYLADHLKRSPETIIALIIPGNSMFVSCLK